MTTEWRSKPLQEVAPAVSAPFPDDGESVWNLSLEDVQAKTGQLLRKTICLAGDLGPSKVAFDTRHVLYSKLRPYLNKVVVPDAPGVATSELIPLAPDPEQLDRAFLAYYLRSPEFVGFAVRNMNGANLPRVSMREFWQRPVPLPSLDEQRRIVTKIEECLLRIDEIAGIHASLNDHPRYIRSAYILELLGLDVLRNWREAYDHQGAFEWVPIEKACSLVSRGKHSKQGSSETFLIKTRHVWPEGVKDYSDCRLAETEAERLRTELVVRQHDVLLACSARGSLGRTCYMAEALGQKATVDTHVAILRADESRALARFLFEFLNSPLGRYLLISAEAGGRWHEEKIGFRYAELNLQDLKQIRIPLPDKDRQQAILDRLGELDALIEPIALDLVKLPAICEGSRDAVLRQAFAGEL